MTLRSYHSRGVIEAGCDEAGRGCLAGPVVAAAVILKAGTRLPGLNDSKALSEAQRDELAPMIREKAVAWAVCQASAQEIDALNILNASFLAMHRAIQALQVPPELLLVDGDRFDRYDGIDHVCMIKGDARFRSIAAASVLAKTHRDAIMCDLHVKHPQYGWGLNKGYPTPEHRRALELHGPCEWHRTTFAPVRLALDF